MGQLGNDLIFLFLNANYGRVEREVWPLNFVVVDVYKMSTTPVMRKIVEIGVIIPFDVSRITMYWNWKYWSTKVE
jgi:hypothetical protein